MQKGFRKFILYRECGQAAVEMALVSTFLFALLFLLFDAFIIGWNWAGVRYALHSGVREAVVSTEAERGPDGSITDPDGYKARARQEILDRAQAFGISLKSSNVPLPLSKKFTGAGDWVELQAVHTVELSPFGQALLKIANGQSRKPSYGAILTWMIENDRPSPSIETTCGYSASSYRYDPAMKDAWEAHWKAQCDRWVEDNTDDFVAAVPNYGEFFSIRLATSGWRDSTI